MTRKARNYDQTAFKVGGSPQPADEVDTEREKEKVTRSKARSARGPSRGKDADATR